jgi:hypothetical protein
VTEIERILELVAGNKISREEATKLLTALEPSLGKLSPKVLENLFVQLAEDQLSPADVAALLERQTVSAGAAYQRSRPGGIVGEVLNEVMGEVSSALGNMGNRKPGARKTSRTLRLEIEGSDGSNVRVNLPLGLANFALKLIPREAQQSMNEQGLDLNALTEMLKHDDLPDGNLVEVENADGTEIRIWIE